jgi:signal transduction histidine kinase
VRKIKVLVVDDDERNVELLTAKLGIDGYETDTAYDGLEALKKVESYNPDLILLDIMMPKVDGYEVCRRLKASEKTKYTPIIMLTAKGEVEDKVLGLDVGAEDYISKPCNLAELSARVRSLLHMRMLQTRLAEMEKLAALGQLVDGVAHEIRNPLMTIGGLARRIKEKVTDEQLQGHINLITHEVERLEKMVERIDEYKKAQVSILKHGDINEVVRESVKEIKNVAEAKAVDIKLSLMQEPPVLLIDKDNLKKAIFHILQNSVDAVNKGGVIEITTMPSEGGYIELVFSDTGCGIKAEDMKNIFNPFYTSKMTGAGLGLTIVYKIIQDHKGDIAIENTADKGVRVSIKLPVELKEE